MPDSRTLDLEAMRAQAGQAARLLKALANPQRLRLLCLLVGQELTVGQLNEHLPELSQSALSQHLAKLREEGMVETRRDAQQIWYGLAEGPAFRMIATLHGIYCEPRTSGTRKGAAAANRAARRRVRKA